MEQTVHFTNSQVVVFFLGMAFIVGCALYACLKEKKKDHDEF